MGAMHCLWVYKFEEKNSCSLVLPTGARMQHIEVEIKKNFGSVVYFRAIAVSQNL